LFRKLAQKYNFQSNRQWAGATVYFLCLLGAGGGSYFLYDDIFYFTSGAKGEVIANLERREARVRRRSLGSYVWENINESEPLYFRESVQTGPNASALIRLRNESLLELSENSLVIIDDVSDLSLSFLQGSAIMREQDRAVRITVQADGQKKLEEFPVQLIFPEPLSEFFVPAGEKKTLGLQARANSVGEKNLDIQKIELQVSALSDFRAAETFRQSLGADSVELSPGQYFWRAVLDTGASSDFAPLSETSRFKISQAETLHTVWPMEGEKIPIWSKSGSVQLRWLAPSRDRSVHSGVLSPFVAHRIELAREAGFENILSSQIIDPMAGSAMVHELVPGRYFWRVQSQYRDLKVSSQVGRFEVQGQEEVPVLLGAPDNRMSFQKGEKPFFTWRTPARGVEFVWELEALGSPVGLSLKEKRGSLSFEWAGSRPGNYRWRVIAEMNGERAGQSEWREFRVFEESPIALSTPKERESFLFWRDPPRFEFSWEDHGGVESLVEVAQDQQFQNILFSHRLTESRISSEALSLEEGGYFWRVSALDEKGGRQRTSQPSFFSLAHYPLLAAPSEIAPRRGRVFQVIKGEDPELQWSEVDGATGYELTIYRGARQTEGRGLASAEVVLQKRVRGLEVKVDELTEGDFFWSVRPIDRIQRRGHASELQAFRVEWGAPLDPPEPRTEGVQ
jgi:hypothetical protein